MFSYSDPGANVLGAVLEAATGLTLDELAERELFQPLGMVDTHALITRGQSLDPRFCSVYQPGTDGNWHKIWEPGDGSIAPFTLGSGTTWYTTLADYARSLSAWLHGGMLEGERWLSDAAVRQALEPGPLMTYLSGHASSSKSGFRTSSLHPTAPSPHLFHSLRGPIHGLRGLNGP